MHGIIPDTMPPNESAARDELRKLIEDYHRLSDERKRDLSEDTVVQQYVNRFLDKVLGWPIMNSDFFQTQRSNRAGRPDATLEYKSGKVIYLEAKRFGAIKDLAQAKTSDANAFGPDQLQQTGYSTERTKEEIQALDYAYKNRQRFAILTNFEKFRLFDARRDTLLISIERPKGYEDRFDLIRPLLYPNILNDSLEELTERLVLPEVDQEYLKFINNQRLLLAQDILNRIDQNAWVRLPGGAINLPTLRAVVQRIIDRLVIVRFAEDHLVVPAETLQSILHLNEHNPYVALNGVMIDFFRGFNRVHNSALFVEHELDHASFSDSTLRALLDALYQARYRSMPADIMGNTYEQYLGKALVSDGSTIRTSDNLETRKKQGSYYTPQVLVRYIVDQSLGRYLYGTEDGKPGGAPLPDEVRKTSRDLRDLRVLDGACGSGSFLIYAYQVLAEFYQGEIARRTAEVNATIDALAAANTDPSKCACRPRRSARRSNAFRITRASSSNSTSTAWTSTRRPLKSPS